MADSKENYYPDLGREEKASLKGGCKLNVNVNFFCYPCCRENKDQVKYKLNPSQGKKKVSPFIKSNQPA